MVAQTIEVDNLVLSALDARHSWDTVSSVLDLVCGQIHYLSERGVAVTMEGEPFHVGSQQSFRRLVEQRGLLTDEAGGA